LPDVAADGASDGLLGESRWLMMSNDRKRTAPGASNAAPGMIIRNSSAMSTSSPTSATAAAADRLSLRRDRLNHTDGRA
jgi:hypothetical protein